MTIRSTCAVGLALTAVACSGPASESSLFRGVLDEGVFLDVLQILIEGI